MHWTYTTYLIPTAAESLVKTYQCQIFAGLGLVELDLGGKILALGIQHVDIIDDAVDVLTVRKGNVLPCRLLHYGFRIGIGTRGLEADIGFIHLSEGLQDILFIFETGLLI